MSKIIQLSLLLGAFLSQLHATQSITLAPIAITSTAIKTDELSSTDAVEVYTQEDIEKAHVQNVYEFLNKSTSVFATSAYGNPFLQKMDIHGFGVADGYQNIVVTINGRKMNNVDMVSQLLASISPSSIKKIEIIKSSGIVVGGDGANAGVINITTKQNNTKEVSLYAGSYGTRDASFYAGHKWEKLSVSVSGETQKNDGIREIDTDRNKDENKFTTASIDLEYSLSDDLTLNIGATNTATDVTYAGTMTEDEYKDNPRQQGTSSGFASSYSTQRFDSTVLRSSVKYSINDDISLSAQVANEIKNSDYDLPAWSSTGHSDYNYVSFNTYLDYTTNNLSIKVGIDGFYADLKYENSSNVDLNMEKDNQAIYLMSEYSKNKFTLKAGLRYEIMKFNESNGDSESEDLSGIELGVNYKLNKNSSVFTNFSRSYQTAQLDRLFSYTNPTTGYMGYVLPSKANNYTLGYNHIVATNKFKISTFYIDMENEIYYYSDPGWTNSRNTNIDKSHKYGLDIYDNYILNNQLNMVLNYNYVQAIIDKEIENGDDYSGNTLPGVSDHNVKVIVNYLPNKNSTLSLTQVYRSEAFAAEDFNNNFSQKQDAFNSTDISATYKKKNWEIFTKINNLFNQQNALWVRDNAIYPVSYTTTYIAGLKLKY
ncbi:TonB-dependent receptor [Sulfurimonas sp.]|jgi:iron complex outermembrane recepter protein|uniref:TonB-dependent receptor n=1 Tax=Sulfurimonas sp. TaxID=2022749 RepID=UPI0025E6812D|nr:TonB-dependent receptor [Sulfurimonas sp.]MBT5935782.1 TonB-dependent receptor [Sulfurimonas sp.]